MKNKVLLFLLIFNVSWGQQKSLSSTEYWQIVQNFHPIVKQTLIDIKQSNASLTIARSAFDPVLQHYSTQKTLDGKNYLDYHAPSLSIPTWYGIEFNAGIENIQGSRLDPSQTVGQTSYLGVQIPLAKNLLMDKRRAALQQAKIMQKMAIQDQRTELNNLLLDAMESYITWVRSHQVLQLVQANYLNATKRLDFVRKSVEFGDRPAVDTLEALTQKQTFENMLTAKAVEFTNARLGLSAFLWNADNSPVDLSDDVVPAANEEIRLLANADLNLTSLLDKAMQNHPEINNYRNKLDVLGIEKKLKFQSLLPKLDVSYNHLSKGGPSLYGASFLENNYKYGIKFELPLRLSEGRGAYQAAKLKLETEQLNLNQKQLQVEIKVRNYFNQFEALQKQIRTQESAYTNYQSLVKAEEMRFENGESSLFLINSREMKSLEAAEKLADLKAYLQKTTFALQASAGVLYEN
ncbi:TolC family protein [Aquirufa regiilacus]|uniref:TolC family protein n=1 Tax=Aquirufa regiilacus TaxID=3024868 RepID=A0ABU3TTP0_9BACT|nr:TolC family protein [Aquirufa sp. LEOWEIH-7C]MDU0809219.1 TolC family protein [Aquirufa sp. LEOWEIH-7C]